MSMNLTEAVSKWKDILDDENSPKLTDPWKRKVTAQIIENQVDFLERGGSTLKLLTEDVPTNATGTAIANWDPILISLVRRSMPNLLAYDVCGVQPMNGPNGLVFAMRSRYTSQLGTEALFDEADTTFSAQNSGNNLAGQVTSPQEGNDPFGTYTTGYGMTTSQAENLGNGTSGNDFNQMAFSIEKVTVTAKSRALKAEYTLEIAQDLKAVHGLDAETELANILSAEILTEINREVIRDIYYIARPGAQNGTAVQGQFDLDVDSNGRWSVEKFKGMIFQFERDSNAIAKTTRRGKGNILIASSDVASALVMAGLLDYTPALSTNLTVDDTGNTFAGVLNGRTKVYIDPYFITSGTDELAVVGYKGSNPYDAGFFYCPYVPLQMVRAVGPDSFQPAIGFKTRYGIVENPFYSAANASLTAGANPYYRIIKILNLL